MPRKPLYYDSDNQKKEVLGTSGSFEQVTDAPSSALPTETVATYSGATNSVQASLLLDPTTKRDFFVSADETYLINGVAQSTQYYYNGTTVKRLAYAQNVLKQVIVSNVQLSKTGDTNLTTMFTGTIPANSIGANGSFHIVLGITWTNSANNKNFFVKFNGTNVMRHVPTTSASIRLYSIWSNRNSLTSQLLLGGDNQGSNIGFNTSSASTYLNQSINTGADITVTVQIQLANATDTATIEQFQILAIG